MTTFPVYGTSLRYEFSQPYFSQIITYTFNDQEKYQPRLGDNLIALIRALQIAYKWKLPVMCPPFDQFDQLIISQKLGCIIQDVTLLSPFEDKNRRLSTLRHGDSLNNFLQKHGSTSELYTIPYGPHDSPHDYKVFTDRSNNKFPFIPIEDSDLEFVKFLRELIAPIQPIEPIRPTTSTAVALHYRRGSGPDREETRNEYPCKFSDFDDCLQLLSGIPITDDEVYCHIFTDIRDEIEKEATIQNFQDRLPAFTFATTPNASELEDFFGMAQPNTWDYFIQPDSQFSTIARVLAQPPYVLKQNLPLQQKYMTA
ncbi:MAG: hypothetical protein H7A39_01060 [Chlamydiales bacterium]|nr:hypothetical protein [Chlamydiales bacterium]